MLCEKCKKVEATVHITETVADAPDQMKKHDFCEACFSQSGLAKMAGGKTPDWTSSGPGYTAAMWHKNEPDR